MIRSRSLWLVAGASSVLAASAALGQIGTPDGQDRGSLTGSTFWGLDRGDVSNTSLLAAPAVQQELHLTDEQWRRIQGFYGRFGAEKGELYRHLRFPSLFPNEKPQDIRAAMQAVDRAGSQELARMLTPAQNRRLAEIAIRQEGIFAIVRPEISEKLGLSVEQVGSARGVIGRMEEREKSIRAEAQALDSFVQSHLVRWRRDVDSMRAEGIPVAQETVKAVNKRNDEEYRKLFEMHRSYKKLLTAAREAAAKGLSELLEPSQKAAFEGMCGKPFDLAELQYNGRPHGRPGPGKPSPKPSIEP